MFRLTSRLAFPFPSRWFAYAEARIPNLSRISALPPAYRLRDPGISRESELFALSSPRHILALVTNVPHYAEARRSRVPCQPKPSGCFQPIPGLIVPYPFGPFREQPGRGIPAGVRWGGANLGPKPSRVSRRCGAGIPSC